jgi:regulatory protein
MEREPYEKKHYSYALRLLTKRDYSRAKVKEKLIARDCPEDEAQALVDELVELKYLREDYYIDARIKGLMHKGLAPGLIQYRLSEEKCPCSLELIYEIFESYGLSENEQIEKLVHKKLRLENYDQTWTISQEARLQRYLMSKGHQGENIKVIMRSVLPSPTY